MRATQRIQREVDRIEIHAAGAGAGAGDGGAGVAEPAGGVRAGARMARWWAKGRTFTMTSTTRRLLH